MTPLMFAVSSETQDARVVRLLLARGADPKIKSSVGETALDWAAKYNNPEVMKALGGSADPPRAASLAPKALGAPEAAAKAVARLQGSSTEFFLQSGCASCHHQNATALAASLSRRAGIAVNEAAAKEQVRGIHVTMGQFAAPAVQGVDLPGGIDMAESCLTGMWAGEQPSSSVTDGLVHYLAMSQAPDGAWKLPSGISRAPIEESNITRTLWAIRALQKYGWPARQAEFDARIARAKGHLLSADPKTGYESAERLLGLTWAGATPAQLAAAAKPLLKMQRTDGGWAQTPYLASDAYATGLALFALLESKALKPDDAPARQAVAFLAGTQREDGTWYVKSRAPKFQPFFESNFPYGHDQWISAAATAYAALGLARTLPAAR
jgi:hypothetical protein